MAKVPTKGVTTVKIVRHEHPLPVCKGSHPTCQPHGPHVKCLSVLKTTKPKGRVAACYHFFE